MLTTGFFKSALEKCADIDIRDAPQFNKNGIYKDVEMSDAEKIVAKKYWEKRDKEYKKNVLTSYQQKKVTYLLYV